MRLGWKTVDLPDWVVEILRLVIVHGRSAVSNGVLTVDMSGHPELLAVVDEVLGRVWVDKGRHSVLVNLPDGLSEIVAYLIERSELTEDAVYLDIKGSPIDLKLE